MKNRFEYNESTNMVVDTEQESTFSIKEFINYLNRFNKIVKSPTLIVEDGSVDTDKLKEDCAIYKSSINELYKSQKQLAIDELKKIKKFLIEKIAEKQACFDSGYYNDFSDGVKTICEILVWEIDKRVKILEEL